MKIFTYKIFSSILLIVYFSPVFGVHLDHDFSQTGHDHIICIELDVYASEPENDKSDTCNTETLPETLIGHILKKGGTKSSSYKNIPYIILETSYPVIYKLIFYMIPGSGNSFQDLHAQSFISFIFTVSPLRAPPQIS